MKKFTKIAIVTIAVGLLAGFGSIKMLASDNNEPVIGNNITVGDISVTGMTKEEAIKVVSDKVDETLASTFNLKVGDRAVSATATQLGISWDNNDVIEGLACLGNVGNILERYKEKKDLERDGVHKDIVFKVDQDVYKTYIESQAQELDLEAIDATVKRENGEFVISDGQSGIEVDVDASYDAFSSYIANEWNFESNDVELVAAVTEPRGTREELSKIKDALGTYSTQFGKTQSGRDKNVINGASLVNGTLLYPGDEFSLTKTVAPFTFNNGYTTASAYSGGKVVPSIGGGICQVSTTLYNALLLAELDIEERYNHSMVIHYAPLSQDAAIAEGYKDLKFVNNQESPIYIEGKTYNGTITFTIYGNEVRPSNRTIKYSSVTTKTIPVTTTNFTQTSDAIGYVSRTQGSFPGYKAELWKTVYVGGVQQSKIKVNSSTYKMVAPYYDVGMSSSNPEAVAAMKAAIATGDLATVKAAASKWNAEALAAEKAAEDKAAAEAKNNLEEQPADPSLPTVPEDPNTGSN